MNKHVAARRYLQWADCVDMFLLITECADAAQLESDMCKRAQHKWSLVRCSSRIRVQAREGNGLNVQTAWLFLLVWPFPRKCFVVMTWLRDKQAAMSKRFIKKRCCLMCRLFLWLPLNSGGGLQSGGGGWMEERWMVNFCAAAEAKLSTCSHSTLYAHGSHLDFLP